MKLNPIENWIFRLQSFNPRKLFNMDFLAGLLTFPIIVIPSHFALHETVDLSCTISFLLLGSRAGFYSSGSVQDFHLIPFSFSIPKSVRIKNTKISTAKVAIIFRTLHFAFKQFSILIIKEGGIPKIPSIRTPF